MQGAGLFIWSHPLSGVSISNPTLLVFQGWGFGESRGNAKEGEWSYSEKKKMLKEKGNLISQKIRSKLLCKLNENKCKIKWHVILTYVRIRHNNCYGRDTQHRYKQNP